MVFTFKGDIVDNRWMALEIQNHIFSTYNVPLYANKFSKKEFNILFSTCFAYNETLLDMAFNDALTLYERSMFYSVTPLKQFLHEIEDLEYYDTARAPYNNFVYVYWSLISNNILFLDTMYNNNHMEHVDSVWTNYLKYIHRHEDGE